MQRISDINKQKLFRFYKLCWSIYLIHIVGDNMRNISAIDTNFKIESKIDKADIKFYNANQEPFKIYGVFYENGKYRRMPEAVAKTVSDGVVTLHTHTAGGRVRFSTDSPYIAIHAIMPSIGKMPHFALTGSAGFDLYAMDDETAPEYRYVRTFVPPFGIKDGYESVIDFGSSKLRQIVINFPLYSQVSDLYIGLSDSATVCPPQPYSIEKPVVFYGSSITQGGCASRPGNSYQSIACRNLNINYVNLGFSGNAKAENAVANYIKDLDMSAFVYDYDHNSPSTDHLAATHEKMYNIVRKANPNLPIVIMARPKFYLSAEEQRRFNVIMSTYNNALSAGDNKVYFIDNKALMSLAGNDGTVDNCHPNDLGFASMAAAVQKVLSDILF